MTEKKKYKLIHSNCLLALKDMKDNCIDSIITDPPYGLSFMGKHWDYDIPSIEIWKECLRVLKPGGHLLSFGGTRTWHRIAVSIEDAGFEIRDNIMWVYGSGFPKSLDISKAMDKSVGATRKVVGQKWADKYPNGPGGVGFHGGIGEYSQVGRGPEMETVPSTEFAKQWDGWGTALKPSVEPIIVAMKPLDGTYVENAQKYGVAGLNIDGARVPTDPKQDDMFRETVRQERRENSVFKTSGFKGENTKFTGVKDKGRWPANVIHDGSEEVVNEFPQVDTARIETPSDCSVDGATSFESMRGNRPARGYDGSGSASRFFYCAKTSREERELGLQNFESKKRDTSRKEGNPGGDNPRNRGVHKIKNNHPTVKPLSLMRYLCKLVDTPTKGVVLDPFMGSGTTLNVANRMKRNSIGIEIVPEYCEMVRAQLKPVELCLFEPKAIYETAKPKRRITIR